MKQTGLDADVPQAGPGHFPEKYTKFTKGVKAGLSLLLEWAGRADVRLK